MSPILGLVAEIYRERHERPGAWALLKDRLDELFPHTFEYKLESGASTTLPLLAPAPADDLWANSPPGSRTNASTPREVSWTDPEAVERRHITLQPALPKEPSPEQRGDVHV